MAKDQRKTITAVVNNMPATTIQKSVELVVVNERLVPDDKDINPGTKLN